MKKYLYLFIGMYITFLSSCTKQQDPARTGLDALIDPKATNYCAFIVGAYHNGVVVTTDTVVMQNTTGDTVEYQSGITETAAFINSNFVGDEYISMNPKSPYRTMYVQFAQITQNLNANTSCSLTDSLIRLGDMNMLNGANDNVPSAGMWLSSSNGTSATSSRTSNATFHVVSITDLPSNNGCKKVRVKATFSNVSYYNSICGPVPQFTVTQGELQMDFTNK